MCASAGASALGLDGKASIIPNGIDVPEPKPETPWVHAGIVFVGGMDYEANIGTVRFFAREVLPRIVERRRDVRFTIVGRDADQRIVSLAR